VPEFRIGSSLLPQPSPSFRELRERIAAIRASSADRERRIDQGVIDATRSLTNIDLTEPVEAGRRAERLGGGVIGPEGILIDQLFTSAGASGADLPANVDERGRPRAINQNNQTGYVLDSAGNLVAVQMLPMWLADP
jgi:hypothetical protein